MILIADSGSTKTHWKLLMPEGTEQDFFSQGLNPFHHSKNFSQVLNDSIPKEIDRASVASVFFYGAGCANEKMQGYVRNNLRGLFESSAIEVNSDLLGAARSLFGRDIGIVLILGTGSNVGFYNGQEVVRHTPSLGYILGDEGSGAHLGRELVRRWMYKEFSDDLNKELADLCHMGIDDILENVYNSDSPAAFLASYTNTIARLISNNEITQLVEGCFEQLVIRHLLKYPNLTSMPLGVVGSVGVVFSQQLGSVLGRYGAKLAIARQYPMEGLVQFHKGA
jgi:N-acetylglucosamine kinase-like BadF-type ATPase